MNSPTVDSVELELRSKFTCLKQAAAKEPHPTLEVRRDRLHRLIDVLVQNQKRISDTINSDFGGRPEALNLIVDVLSAVRSLKYASKNVERWMRPDMRKPEFPLGLIGAKAGVFYQPLGVVGNMSPWNAPITLAFSPLSSVIAAGNRAFLKPSELVPQTADLIADMIRSAFDPSEIDVAIGGVDVAQAFTHLPFDHLIFTGGAGTARHVMRAAAENLVPLTLELGGKAPCIVKRGSDLAYAAAKFAGGKCINAGQVCMSPDFAYVHHDDKEAFARAVKVAVTRMHPQYSRGPDFTRVHLDRQRNHLAAMVADAVKRGAKVEVLDGTPVDGLAVANNFPPVIVVDPPLDSAIMQDEVFGPVMPIIGYDSLQEVVDMLGKLSRPLALYFLGGTAEEKTFMLKNTWSGGVSFDDVQLHVMMQDYGQGGVGESGMGRYLGFDGFKAMSNAKAFAQRPWIDISKYIAPPYGPSLVKALRKALGS
jgi:coniferyl-aldehyde dehydrogenase